MTVRAPASRARRSSRVASSLQLSSSQISHAARQASREPARLLGWEDGLFAERAQRGLEDRHGRGVTVDGQRRNPLKEEIGRPRRPARWRGRPAPPCSPRRSPRRGRAGRRTGPPRALRDTWCAPAPGRPPRAPGRPSAAARERRRRAARRTRSARAGDAHARAGDHRRRRSPR